MSQETWRDTEYPNYQVSNLGRVRKFNHILSGSHTPNGYRSVSIKNKKIYIHRLVAQTFIENPNNWPQVNHKNGNKQDNMVENLEWCTRRMNIQHSNRILKHTKVSSKHGRVLCIETKDVFLSTKDVERKTGLCGAAIRRVLCGQTLTSAGYHWTYTDKPITNINTKLYKKHRGIKKRIAQNCGISTSLLYWREKNGWSFNDIKNTKPNLANKHLRRKRAGNSK